jgi:Fe-S-cluster containining protein
MGYPAFVLPVAARTEAELESHPELRQQAKDPQTRKRLLAGMPGERNWYNLTDDLRIEWEEFVRTYQSPRQGELDPPCFWLNEETRLCKHHEYRPDVCRNFDIGSSGCLDWRKFYSDRVQKP